MSLIESRVNKYIYIYILFYMLIMQDDLNIPEIGTREPCI